MESSWQLHEITLLLSPCYRWSNRGTDCLNNWANATLSTISNGARYLGTGKRFFFKKRQQGGAQVLDQSIQNWVWIFLPWNPAFLSPEPTQFKSHTASNPLLQVQLSHFKSQLASIWQDTWLGSGNVINNYFLGVSKRKILVLNAKFKWLKKYYTVSFFL